MPNFDNTQYEEPIENPYAKSEYYMDYLFKFYPIEIFELETPIEASDLKPEQQREAKRLITGITNILVKEHEYAKFMGKYPFPIQLTALGREVKKIGGHYAYENYKKELNKPHPEQNLTVQGNITGSQLNQSGFADDFRPMNIPITQEIPQSNPPTKGKDKLLWLVIVPIIVAVIAGLILMWFQSKK